MHPLLERNTYVISLDGLGGIPLEMAIAGFRKDRFTADRPFLEISHWSALSGRNGASNYQTFTQMHNRFRNDTKTPQRISEKGVNLLSTTFYYGISPISYHGH